MTSKEDIRFILSQHLSNALFSVDHPKPHRRGKVRDLYEMGEELWMVVTDRVSAFDIVLGTIPCKGALLAEQTCFWFEKTSSIVKNHLLKRPDPQILVCQKTQPIMVEVIIRGFLAGSLMRENPLSRGSAYGLRLDPDLKPFAQFEKPIITPTTKAHSGHDQPLSKDDIIGSQLVSKKTWEQIEEIAVALFNEGNRISKEHGFYLVDTKYEFGIFQDELMVIDEIHTADSSRFFAVDDYHQSLALQKSPNMLDKEFLRRKLIEDGFDPNTSPDLAHLTLSDELRLEVACRYFELTERLLGGNFAPPKESANLRIPQTLHQLMNNSSL